MGKSIDSRMGSNSLERLASKLTTLANPECDLCPLNQDTERVCIPVTPAVKRSKKGRFICVAEAPGHNEELTGQLLSGRAGEYRWETLEGLGFERNQFFITNAVKCRPEDNRTPTDREIRVCHVNYLEEELRLIKPKFGLALGNSGLKATLGRKGITKYNGTTFEYAGATWVAAFHPAAVLRNPRYLDSFKGAMLVFKRLVYDESGVPETRSIAVNDKDSLRQLIATLKGAKRGAIDIETWSDHGLGGLAFWDPTFAISALCISCKPGLAYVVPLWMEGSRWRRPEKVLEVLKPYIEAVPYWYMQNGKFDEKGLEQFGISIKQSFDTMGAVYVLDENNRKDLGFLASVYLGADDYKETIDKKHTNLAPIDDMVEYGGKDADYTLRLGRKLPTELKSEPLARKLYRRLLMPAVNVLSDVERIGLPVHRGTFRKRRAIVDGRIAEARDARDEYVPQSMRPLNPNSTQQLGRLLYDHMGLPVVQETPKGNPSTAEGALIRLKDIDESGVLDAIMEYRKWAGYRSRYFENWALRMDGRGRLHSNFKIFHTVTGRLSSSNPALQQIPRDTFMRGIIGGRRGWTFVEVDYSQVELRVVAHVSQDRAMLRAYNLDLDLHTETAMAITGRPESEIDPETRKMAKAVNFGFVYGMGYGTFVVYAKEKFGIDISPERAKVYRDDFFDSFRGLYPWHARQRKAAKRRKWVISPVGRKRHLWDIESTNESIRAEAERQAINSPVQSLASDMMLYSMVLLHPKLDPNVARIVSTVHDSILFEIRDEAVDDLLPMIVETMENLPLEERFGCRLTVPIRADVKVGRFWSEGASSVSVA